jgi:hypothetical protein
MKLAIRRDGIVECLLCKWKRSPKPGEEPDIEALDKKMTTHLIDFHYRRMIQKEEHKRGMDWTGPVLRNDMLEGR